MQKGASVLLAVSGGVDSVVLCRLFSLAGFRSGIAHCNFRLRGKDSDADQQFVSDLAAKSKAPFFTAAFDTADYAAEKGISAEMAARELRYRWLEETRKAHGFHKIATAHHRDDSIETVLLNLIKGTGISGLHGILPARGKIIRPLLAFGKEEILAFAEKEKLAYRQDYTNFESFYQRNFIRNEIIPKLKELNPHFMETFAGNIEKFRDAEAIFKRGLELLKKKMLERRGDEFYIPLKKLLLLEGNKTVLYELLKGFGFGEKQVVQIYAGLNEAAGKQYFSEKFRVIKDRNFLIVASKEEEQAGWVTIENIKKVIKVKDGLLKFHLMPGAKFNTGSGSDIAYFDYSRLQFPLTLRRWKAGDYFYPLGMDKKKKLSDFFTDIKLPVLEKERAWVLLSGEKIAWVVGYRIDERFKVTEKTTETLMMKWKRWGN
ncbi:MAG TPA: tRNA lysidine(34) synthetase TilS [Chitinophagales bacterium]|nr:tRNA lysidine(34) synthetase TilS [Chitinophagales bacterium]